MTRRALCALMAGIPAAWLRPARPAISMPLPEEMATALAVSAASAIDQSMARAYLETYGWADIRPKTPSHQIAASW